MLRLTRLVDLSLALIRSGQLSLAEANAVTAQARSAAELLFPGSAPTFDLIHAPRFRRAIGEVFAIHH